MAKITHNKREVTRNQKFKNENHFPRGEQEKRMKNKIYIKNL